MIDKNGRRVCTPTIGQVVHFLPTDTAPCEPVIVTDGDDVGVGDVSILRFGQPLGIPGVQYDQDERKPGTWHYPCASCK